MSEIIIWIHQTSRELLSIQKTGPSTREFFSCKNTFEDDCRLLDSFDANPIEWDFWSYLTPPDESNKERMV